MSENSDSEIISPGFQEPDDGGLSQGNKKLTFCTVCNVNCRTPEKYQSHIQSALHLQICDGRLFLDDPPESESKRSEPKTKSANKSGGSTAGWAAHSDNVLFCHICQVPVTGKANYQVHIKGAKHKKLLQLRDQCQFNGKPVVRPIKYREGKLQAERVLAASTSDLIGLQFLVEFQHPTSGNAVCHECFLCFNKMNMGNLTTHFSGLKHSLAYVNYLFPDYLPKDLEVTGSSPQELKSLIRKVISMVKPSEGKQKPSVYMWDGTEPQPNVFSKEVDQNRKRCSAHLQKLPPAKCFAADTGAGSQRPVRDFSHEPPVPKPTSSRAGSRSSGAAYGITSLKKICNVFENFEIRDEQEADLVVKLSLALSNSLKRYRRRTVSKVDEALHAVEQQFTTSSSYGQPDDAPLGSAADFALLSDGDLFNQFASDDAAQMHYF